MAEPFADMLDNVIDRFYAAHPREQKNVLCAEVVAALDDKAAEMERADEEERTAA